MARAIGVAYDFEAVFSAWFLSGKERFARACMYKLLHG
jgi:hypothetical protein